jgi:hypothetical protein
MTFSRQNLRLSIALASFHRAARCWTTFLRLAIAGTLEIIIQYDLTPMSVLVNLIVKSGHVLLSTCVRASSSMNSTIHKEPVCGINDVVRRYQQ